MSGISWMFVSRKFVRHRKPVVFLPLHQGHVVVFLRFEVCHCLLDSKQSVGFKYSISTALTFNELPMNPACPALHFHNSSTVRTESLESKAISAQMILCGTSTPMTISTKMMNKAKSAVQLIVFAAEISQGQWNLISILIDDVWHANRLITLERISNVSEPGVLVQID